MYPTESPSAGVLDKSLLLSSFRLVFQFILSFKNGSFGLIWDSIIAIPELTLHLRETLVNSKELEPRMNMNITWLCMATHSHTLFFQLPSCVESQTILSYNQKSDVICEPYQKCVEFAWYYMTVTRCLRLPSKVLHLCEFYPYSILLFILVLTGRSCWEATFPGKKVILMFHFIVPLFGHNLVP